MTYAEKLRTHEWRQFRLRLINKAGRKCVECGCVHEEEEPLQIHHVIYIRRMEPWDYPDELCLVLCDSCHFNRQVNDEETQVEFARMCARMPSIHVYELGKRLRQHLQGELHPKLYDAYAALLNST